MKHTLIIIILLITITLSCKKSPFTCDISKTKITKRIDLETFDTIEVNPLIRLKIFDTTFNKMTIKASKDIWQNINYKIENQKLILTNDTYCLIENTDAIAEVHLYVNQVKCLIANTDLKITSGNKWRFDQLHLICENNQTGTNNIADFDLEVQINKLRITANGTSIFDIKGTCNDLFVGFYGVNPVFKGKNLIAQKISFFQRSDADMHFYPVQEISGDLFGYGDIYLYHRPPIINITEHYAGHIYFVN